MEGGNFHLIFTRRCPLTFCSTLRYHAIFEETIEEATPQPTYLTSISKLRQKRSIGPDAREIQSVRSSDSQDDRYSWFISSYFTITLRCASQLRSSFLFPAMLFSRGRGLIRTLIRDDLSGLGAVDGRARPVIARSHGLLFFLSLLLLPETINLMGIYRRAKIPWAVVHPCQTVINVSKDRYLLWSRYSSLFPARSLAVSFSPGFPFFSPSCVRVGNGPEPFPPSYGSLYSPLFIADPPASGPPSFSAPFVTRGCRPSAVLLSVFLLRVHVPLFSSSLPSSETPCVFPDNATEPGQGCMCTCVYVCFEFATRFSLDRNKRVHRVVDARVAWLLKFPHDVTTFRGIRSVKKLLQPTILLCRRESQNA